MEARRAEPSRANAPDPALFWTWMAKAIRPRLGWVLTGIGAIAIIIGYLGVSTRVLVAEQLPYLISGGIGGMALVIVGGVFLATDDTRTSIERIDELEGQVAQLHGMVADLHTALLRRAGETRTVSSPASAPAAANGNGHSARRSATRVYALPSGSTFHRSGCSVLEGKSTASAVSAATVEERGLTPCSLCTPTLARQ